MSNSGLPSWSDGLLQCPLTGDRLCFYAGLARNGSGLEVGRIEDGMLRVPIHSTNDGIRVYRAVGGAHFHERTDVAFAMSGLDTPVYHTLIQDLRPDSIDSPIIDVGAGDGRNAWPWLERGYRRIVLVDAAGEALLRFRSRVAERNPDWVDRLLLIEADARHLPLATGAAAVVQAIESLYYLNEDYQLGLSECTRVLASSGKLLVSERDYEGGLMLSLLYRGVGGVLASADIRSVWDGPPQSLIRSRCFTEEELIALMQQQGLEVVSVKGTPILSLLLGWMRGAGLLKEGDSEHLAEVRRLLDKLATSGAMRRCHVVIARKLETGLRA
jgi:SAM-dependent methyltransferase